MTIIDNLRKNCEEVLSLVAVEEEQIVGHIFFSPVIIEEKHGIVKGMGTCTDGCIAGISTTRDSSQLVNKGMEELR